LVVKNKLLRSIKKPMVASGFAIVLLVLFAALFAPQIAPHEPNAIDLRDRLTPPCRAHLLGSDQFGRDILSRILFGARTSLLVGLAGTTVGLLLGSLIGVISGYRGGWVDELFMRAMDVLMSFPYLILGMGLMAVFGASLRNVIVTIGIIYIPRFARLVRGLCLSLREREYIKASKSVGAGPPYTIVRHIIPNSMAPIIVLYTLSIGVAINMEAALSFLGLGIPPPTATWGGLINNGRAFMLKAPWIATFPGIAISLTVLGYNLLGDALRDISDVKL
jgi:peptide/nickel transport system permease protein